MSRSPFLRKTALLLLALVLLAPAASWAAPARGQAAGDALAAFWSLLHRLATASGCVIDPSGCQAARSESGCILDPSGGCAAAQAPGGCIINPNGGTAPSGCIIDPNGSAAPSGCILDPNGSAASLDHGDGGCILDPDGRGSK